MNEAPESELEERGVSVSRVVTVQTRALVAESDEALMALARQRAQDPSVFEDFPPLFLGGEISSTRWDAYETSMSASTLQNFAREARDGVAVLLNHRTYRDPIGHSLAGKFVGGGGNGVARTESDFFLFAPDAETEATVRRVRAGVVRDISVGFHGGVWRCTICKNDMMRWGWSDKNRCPHLLGVWYTPRDEAGQERGEAVKARANIEDAHLAEFSICYDGATPGAMLKKARSLATEGLLSDRERQFVQQRYRTALPEKHRQFPGATIRKETTTMNEPQIEEGGVRLSDGRLLTATDVNALAIASQAVRAVLDGAKAPKANEPAEAVRELLGDVTRLRALEADVLSSREGEEPLTQTVARLRRLADDGTAYRADLIEQALAEGVRAYGEGFAREQEKQDLASSSLETIKRRSAQWKLTADQLIPKGRQSGDGEEPPATQRQGRPLPPSAYA